MIPDEWAGSADTSHPRTLDPDGFRARYAAYRLRQVARLLRMLPKGAVRSLFRRARLAFPAEPESVAEDPLAILTVYCEGLLPLPPFEVWLTDLLRHPDAHMTDLQDSVDQPTADRPSTVMTRAFGSGGRRWNAHLRSFRESGLWRAYIAFQEEGSERVHRTGTVFCEHDVQGLRRSFETFETAALEAFLRSALP